MRGFFAIGVERISKPMNVGNLMRSAHGFGASFFFTIDAHENVAKVKSDTSKAPDHLPYYQWDTLDDMKFPEGCQLVGVELLDDAVDLPSFRHPVRAAYVLGPERGSLSPELQSLCDHIVKIPTSFCTNVATAGAIIMYDRMISFGRFADRPVRAGAPPRPLPAHTHGTQRLRKPKNILNDQ